MKQRALCLPSGLAVKLLQVPSLRACCAAGFCKQQLWPLFHYLLPLSPNSTGRFNPELWQAYVKANKASS
jgi:hypothetical protein